MATVVYDSLGGEHSVNFSFEKIAGENEWIWTAAMEGNEEILSGGSGRIRFADNGSISNFTYDDDSGALTFAPQNAAEEGAAGQLGQPLDGAILPVLQLCKFRFRVVKRLTVRLVLAIEPFPVNEELAAKLAIFALRVEPLRHRGQRIPG